MGQRSGTLWDLIVRWTHSDRGDEQRLASLRWRDFGIRHLEEKSFSEMEEPLQKPWVGVHLLGARTERMEEKWAMG